MQNNKLILMFGVLVLLVGLSAFLAGRLINSGFRLSENSAPVSVNIVPALELPTTSPDVTGLFIERRDNAIIVEIKSSDTKSASGPQMEVVVTNDTIIYRETTQLNKPLTGGNQTIQQTVEETTLDPLDARSMLIVWGRKSGDRIIADVLMYSNTAEVKRVIFEDCTACP